ncbi:MAG: putative toxin-antitoxin system toxin component, PIN family [Bacteroidales bacterium]|nr:putative toxin-antitoxin system toxin component, PIN family [Bacteroidales bacterium]MBS3776839.1 putative toxin-antitoxin system toxin component, PIN family [Bacteroidales bacterium]
MKSKKVILDTNLWISFLIKHDYSFLDKYIEKGKVKLIFYEELIQEFLTVATRPKFQKFFTDDDIQNIIQTFDQYGILIKVTTEVNICRDFKDNFLLNLAIDSNADYLVTGDEDLLEINNIQETKILTIRELKNEL